MKKLIVVFVLLFTFTGCGEGKAVRGTDTCEDGTCATPTPTPFQWILCRDDNQCPAGKVCQTGRCVSAPPSPTPTPSASSTPSPPQPPPWRCTTNRDCEDGNPCTRDGCTEGGVCASFNKNDGEYADGGEAFTCRGSITGHIVCQDGAAVFRAEESCSSNTDCITARCVEGRGCEYVLSQSPVCGVCAPGDVYVPSTCTRNSQCVHEEYGEGVCQSRGGDRVCTYTRICP